MSFYLAEVSFLIIFFFHDNPQHISDEVQGLYLVLEVRRDHLVDDALSQIALRRGVRL
jgi:hypothetical protein